MARGDGGDEQRRRPETGDVEDVAKEQREGSEWHIRILRLRRARLRAQPSSTTPVAIAAATAVELRSGKKKWRRGYGDGSVRGSEGRDAVAHREP